MCDVKCRVDGKADGAHKYNCCTPLIDDLKKAHEEANIIEHFFKQKTLEEYGKRAIQLSITVLSKFQKFTYYKLNKKRRYSL